MMQPTHLKFGIAWGLLAIPIAVFLGIVPSLGEDFRYEDVVYIMIGLYAAMKGAIFGSEAPDTDHPTSIPARKHPILAKYFEIGRKITNEDGSGKGPKKKWYAHRGIMSHDYLVHIIRWGILYAVVSFISVYTMQQIASGNDLITVLIYISMIVIIWSFTGDLHHLTNYVLNKAGVKVGDSVLVRVGIFVLAMIIVLSVIANNFGGALTDILMFNLDLGTASLIAMWFFYAVKIFIIFTCVGCISHLFGDMITVSGVYLGTFPIKPMGMFKILTKIPGLNLAFDGFRTGGPWEKINNTIITIVIVPATILAVMTVFGWDISNLFNLPDMLSSLRE